MKKLLGIAALIGSILVTGCGRDEYSSQPAPPPPAPTPLEQTNAAPMPAPPDQTPVVTAPITPTPSTTPPADVTTPNPTPAIKPAVNYPMGIVIPGKKGFVKSPYAEYAEPVDVRGYPPGTAVRCPYTKKIFIVPAQE